MQVCNAVFNTISYLCLYRVPTGKVVFEIGGGIREEIARDGMQSTSKLA